MMTASSSASARKIRRRAKMFRLHELLNLVLRNVLNVGLAAVQLLDFRRVRVKAGDAVSGFGEAQPERQSHISTTNNSDAKLRALKIFRPAVCWHGSGFRSCQISFRGFRAEYNNFLISEIPAAAHVCLVANPCRQFFCGRRELQGVPLRF